MKLLTLGVLLCAPASGQVVPHIETATHPISFSTTGADCFCYVPNIGLIRPGDVPGRLVETRWSLTLDFTGTVTFVNGASDTRVIDGFKYGGLFFQVPTVGDPPPYGGSWSHSFGSNPIPPGGSETLPVFDSILTEGTLTPQFIPDSLSMYGPFAMNVFASNFAEFDTFQSCTPSGTNCFGVGGPQDYDIDLSVTGAFEFDFEPYVGGVSQACDGDGTMTLELFGDWGTQVHALSNGVGEFSMLFMGVGVTDWPGTEFCISSGQRITASLAPDRVDHLLDMSTITAGQTFVLQAVHRVQGGGVAFSNALLAFPF